MVDRETLLPAPTTDLRKRTLTGTALVGSSQAVKVVVQLLSVVILGRLLAPSDVGVFAMILPFSTFVGLFQDLGLTQALTTAKSLTTGQASTMFWLNLLMSAALGAILALGAPLIAGFYGEPRLQTLTIAVASTFILSGLMTVQFALLNRTMQFGKIAAIDIMSSVGGLICAVCVAVFYPSPWAFVAALVGGQLISLVAAWLMSNWKPIGPGRFEEIKRLLHFGAGVTGFNITNFFARSMDNVLIGRFAGPVQLGFYDRAYKLMVLPLQQVNRPIGRVLIPALSRLVDEPHRYRHAYTRVVQQTLLLIVPAVIALVFTADAVIYALLGPQWGEAAPIFAWLAIAALHQPLTTTIGWLFISQGRTSTFARWGLFNAVVCVSAFAIGLPRGAVGVAQAYALADTLILLPAVWYLVGRKGPVRTKDLVNIARPFIVAGCAAALAVFAASHILSGLRATLDGWPFLLACFAVSYSVFLIAMLALRSGREALQETSSIAKSVYRGVLGRIQKKA